MTIPLSPPNLSSSWNRCSDQHNLNPSERWEARLLTPPELRFLSHRTHALIRHAIPEMQRLHQMVMPLDFTILLADTNGVVLSRQTTPNHLKGCRKWGFQVGALWDEATAGTNGIGTCLAEKKPLMVVQEQHWRVCFRSLVGISAPLYTANGELAGVLNICSFAGKNVFPYANLLMDSTITTAQRIEDRLFREYYSKDTIITLGNSTSSSAPLLALTPEGQVSGATFASRTHMNWPAGDLRSPPPSLHNTSASLSFDTAERHVIASALAASQGNVSAAARTLGISRSTLHRKIKSLTP